MANSPLADLTYRDYDGPMGKPGQRWWVITRQMVKAAFKKKVFWIMTLLSGWYFLTFLMMTFVFDTILGGAQPDQAERILRELFSRIIWKAQMLNGFSTATVYLLVLALVLGAGAIANDNRTNALLVYLSKPCTKRDYLFGKWMGIFLPMTLALSLPGIAFYCIGALNYRQQGFLSSYPPMLPAYLLTIVCATAFMSSICLGVSSLFNQGRLAGATIAGLFFLAKFFTTLLDQIARNSMLPDGLRRWLDQATYLSVDGLMFGMGKILMNTDGQALYAAPQGAPSIPAPNLGITLFLMVAISAIFIAIANARVKAVEVVS